MRKVWIILGLTFLLGGCSPLENNARDAAAAAQGFIEKAQKNHLQECITTPTKDFPCQTINRAVGAQNLLISTVEMYCGYPANPSADALKQYANQPCARKKDVQQSLANAITSLNSILAEYKLTSNGKP